MAYQVLQLGVDTSLGRKPAPGYRAQNYLGSTNPMISTYEFLSTWLRARFADSERGASLVEYALLVALIAVVCIVAIRFLGTEANDSFSSTGSAIN